MEKKKRKRDKIIEEKQEHAHLMLGRKNVLITRPMQRKLKHASNWVRKREGDHRSESAFGRGVLRRQHVRRSRCGDLQEWART